MNKLFRTDGSPMYITFAKASGKRSNVIQINAGKHRLALSADGVDFSVQWTRAVQFLVGEMPIVDVAIQQKLMASSGAFLDHYGIVLKQVTMLVFDSAKQK